MSRNNKKGNPSLAFDLSSLPPLPTAIKARLSGGRVISTEREGGMWLVRQVPMAPMTSAKSDNERVAAAGSIMAAYREVAELSGSVGGRRGLSKSTYRETQLLTVNVPTFYNPAGHPNEDRLRRLVGDQVVPKRVSLFAVRLIDSLGTGKGFMGVAKSLAEQWQQRSIPVDAFNKDFDRVDAALSRAGLIEPEAEAFALADAWWNHGSRPDTPFLPHLDHMHVFPAAHLMTAADKIGLDDCETWPQHGLHVPSMTFASVSDINLHFVSPESHAALWATSLFREGALAVSVRGLVEPARITRGELRRNQDKHAEDIRERFEAGKHNKEEQRQHLADLEEVERQYALDGGTPTLIESAVTVAFSGSGHDPEILSTRLGNISVAPLEKRQPNAWREMLLASTTRANPTLHDLPVQTIAHAGFQSLAEVGDDPTMKKTGGRTHSSALLGFSEEDRQPAYVTASASSAVDAYPFMLLAGATRSGKTMALLWLAFQWADQGTPVILVDPKPHDPTQEEQGFAKPVLSRGGQVFSLSELLEVDGVFDPIRTSIRPEEGVLTAASLLGRINPFGTTRADIEVDLRSALTYGVQQGATCTGQALQIAAQNNACPPAVWSQVKKVLDSDPVFRSMVGMDPKGETLRVTNRLTLIEAGSFPLELPDPGSDPTSLDVELGQRITSGLVGSMVRGSTMALSGRDGVVMLDEAWMFLAAGFTEVERLGRLAGSQRVFPVLATQRVSDARDAGLSGYISRGLILHLPEEEAYAAAELFNQDPTPELISRISAPEWRGAAPNWNSLKALWDRKGAGRNNLRGAVGYYFDLDGRVSPTEIVLPKAFLDEVSTNSLDVDARAAAARAAAAAVEPQGARPTPVW